MNNPQQFKSFIVGQDASLESSTRTTQAKLAALGFHVQERSWPNLIEGVCSVDLLTPELQAFHNARDTAASAAAA